MKEQLFCSKCGKVNWSRWGETCECKEPDYRFESYDDYLAHEKEKTSAKGRDWKKDMERAKLMAAAGEYEGWTEPLIYWLQQYAAEKERADKREQERDDAISGLTESYKELSWNYDRMKLRERELKETMKWAIEQSKWGDPENALVKVIAMLQKTLDSLYPKEETK